MKRKMKQPMKYSSAVIVLLFLSANVFSHGLNMTSAEIHLRHDNHITITLRTKLGELFNHINWAEKPASLVHMASADDKTLTAFSDQLKHLFIQQMPISFSGQALESRHLRLPSADQLKKQLHTEVANNILLRIPAHQKADNTQENQLVVYVDGFIPQHNEQPLIEIIFPKALGDITVSYSKPQLQTLSAGQGITHYAQKLY